MGRTSEFARILEEKLGPQSAAEMREIPQFPEASPSERQEFDSDLMGLAWMMGRIPKHKLTETNKSMVYHRLRSKPHPRPAHELSPEQKSAYELLRHYVSELPAGFTKSELKRAYRRALFLVHPDYGGTSRAFLQVKSAYALLLKSLFTAVV